VTDIVFDGPPGPIAPSFIEVENPPGTSIRFGEWIKRKDGYWVLRIPDDDYYPSHEALVDLVQLWAEHEALNGGGPGWRERFRSALAIANELTRIEP
jgi:hypothetical protein